MVSRTLPGGLDGVATGLARAASSTLQCNASSRVPSEKAALGSDVFSNQPLFLAETPGLGTPTLSPFYNAHLRRMPSSTNLMMPPPLANGLGGSCLPQSNSTGQIHGLLGEKQGESFSIRSTSRNGGLINPEELKAPSPMEGCNSEISGVNGSSAISGIALADAKSFLSNLEPATSSTSTVASQPLTNSTSDEDQQVAEDRRQKRMLSNRESARRSRMRKQQHLDDLRAQVALLRAENNQMMSRYNVASRQYAQLTEENRVLSSHATDLSRQLRRLHLVAIAQQQHDAYGLRSLGNKSGIFDPISGVDFTSPSFFSSSTQPLSAFAQPISSAYILH